jgi:hypothetical protein
MTASIEAKREVAAARRAALRESISICDALADLIKSLNPGRTKGSVSRRGLYAAACLRDAANNIQALRNAREVPEASA